MGYPKLSGKVSVVKMKKWSFNMSIILTSPFGISPVDPTEEYEANKNKRCCLGVDGKHGFTG